MGEFVTIDVHAPKLVKLFDELTEKFEKKIDSVLAKIVAHLKIGKKITLKQTLATGVKFVGHKDESSATTNGKTRETNSFVRDKDIPKMIIQTLEK